MKRLVPLVLFALATLALAVPAAARPARAGGGGGAHARVSVQPFEGEVGPSMRALVARILRGRGFRVTTSVSRVSGTGQYLELARDHRLCAFVTGELDERPRRHSVTFLVWDGASGSVIGRWSAAAPPKKLGRAIGKGFWKHLGPAFDGAHAPPSTEMEEAPPVFINAGQVN